MFALLLAVAAAQELRPLRADERLAFAVWRPSEDVLRDLRDLRRAGVDVALLEAVVEGLPDALEKAGDDRPLLAPLLDGAAPVDSLRRFLERIPTTYRAFVDGRLLVFLGPAPESGRGVPVEGLKAAAGGSAPYLVADVTWTEAAADRRWRREGLPEDWPVTTVPVGREAGDYEKAWFAALRLEARWAVVADWGAVRDLKLGEATARYVRKHRVNEKITLPKGKWTGAGKALYTAKYNPHEQGLRPLSTEEGGAELVQLRGMAMLSSKELRKGPRRALTFDVDDSFSFFEKRSYSLTIEFLDAGTGSFRVEYDAGDRGLPPPERHVKSAGERSFSGSGEWREETLDLPDAMFGNGQPGGGDLRIVLEGRGIAVRRVALTPR